MKTLRATGNNLDMEISNVVTELSYLGAIVTCVIGDKLVEMFFSKPLRSLDRLSPKLD